MRVGGRLGVGKAMDADIEERRPALRRSVFVGDEVAEGIAGPAPIIEELRGLLGSSQRGDHLLLAAFGFVDQDQAGRHLVLRGQQLEQGQRLRRDVAVRFGRFCRVGGQRRRLFFGSGVAVGRGSAVGVTVARAFGSAADSGAAVGVPGAVTRASAAGEGAADGTISPRTASRKTQPSGRDGRDQHHGDGDPAQRSPLAALPARQQWRATGAPGA